VGTFPVHLATILAAAQAVAMVLTTFALAAGGPALQSNALLAPFPFTWAEAVTQGHIWQFVTYLLVAPPSFWTLIQIVLLAMFGTEVEKFLGRRAFLWLYVALILAVPLLYAVLGFLMPTPTLSGSAIANFGVFAAFVLLYPKAEIFLGIQARWIGLALLALNSLMALSVRDFAGLAALWWICGVAFAFLRLEGAGAAFPQLLPMEKATPAPRARKRPRKAEDLHTAIDPILEKISRSGFGSLTREERERLDRARAALLEREGGDP
jgi:membrane associated rhomboid family serine protease